MFTGPRFITTRRIVHRNIADQFGRDTAAPWQRAFAVGFLIAASPFKAFWPSCLLLGYLRNRKTFRY